MMIDASRDGQERSHAWVKDLKDNDRVNGLYLARDKKVGQT